MDTPHDRTTTVALPGIFAKVKLPQLPNFLQPVTGGQPIPLGTLDRGDVAVLGLALQRALASHWHDKFTARERLSAQEGEQIGADLVHPAIVETMARREADREGFAWSQMHQAARAERMNRMRATLHDFIQELTRHG